MLINWYFWSLVLTELTAAEITKLNAAVLTEKDPYAAECMYGMRADLIQLNVSAAGICNTLLYFIFSDD